MTEKLEICDYLNELLTLELSLGNSVSHFDNHAKWPYPETHFVMLAHDLHTHLETLRYSKIFPTKYAKIFIMVGMMNVYAKFIMTYCVQVVLSHFSEYKIKC